MSYSQGKANTTLRAACDENDFLFTGHDGQVEEMDELVVVQTTLYRVVVDPGREGSLQHTMERGEREH